MGAAAKDYKLKGPAASLGAAGKGGKQPKNIARDIQRKVETMHESVSWIYFDTFWKSFELELELTSVATKWIPGQTMDVMTCARWLLA